MVGIANAVIWPALAFLIVPLSVLTLGLGAIVLNALFVTWLLELLPGVEVDGLWTSFLIVVGLVVLTTASLDAARARRRRLVRPTSVTPGP